MQIIVDSNEQGEPTSVQVVTADFVYHFVRKEHADARVLEAHKVSRQLAEERAWEDVLRVDRLIANAEFESHADYVDKEVLR